MSSTLVWTVLFPFIGSAILGVASLVGGSKLNVWAGRFASGILFLSFVNGARLGYHQLSNASGTPTVADLGTWIAAGNLQVQALLSIDALSAVMVLVVTGVGFLIHVYSIGYMSHDPNRGRYFSYLNLFCGFMLLLITAGSLPILFIGWEGVGLCSYLLIGFWYPDIANAQAGRKAFVVNRIGDAGFLIAMFLIYQLFGTLNFTEMVSSSAMKVLNHTWALEWIGLFLFIGCVGKSAQFPLYIWLPDAMAGPTPVSALIHAATMVTAGVYLLARMSFLYEATTVARETIAAVGAFTALWAASIAIVQKDIKKVLAFSTVSQLGFMVLAMGVSAYAAGIFHLVTHAYFKALLFLGAGSVIHALHGEQNILKMGGLKNYIVLTTVVFGAGCLAIIGIPPFSGFFSKDAILYSVYESGKTHLFVVAVIAALLTTVYMTRLFCLVFIGVPRISREKIRDIHESPFTMVAPMAVLAFLAFVGGFFPLSVKPVLTAVLPVAQVKEHVGGFSEGQFAFWLTVTVLSLSALTYRAYTAWYKGVEKAASRMTRLTALTEKQYRFDDLMVGLGTYVSKLVSEASRLFDEYVIDGAVNGIAKLAQDTGVALTRLQTGLSQGYALLLIAGALLMAWALMERLA